MPCFEYTTGVSKPEKVIRLELELVDFSIVLTTQDGNQITLKDQTEVQTVLNEARNFNEQLDDTQCNNGRRSGDDEVKIEIKLDPVNSINTFVIPV